MDGCMLCGSMAVINRQESASRTIYNCPSCGIFVVSDLVADSVKSHICETLAYLMRHKLAGFADTVLLSFEKANLDRDYLQLTIEQVIDAFPGDFTEQMDMSLRNLEMMSDFAGDEIRIEGLKDAPYFYVRKISFEALSFVIKSMQKAELVDVAYYAANSFFPCGVTIAPKGWDRLAEIRRGKPRRNSVLFCAGQGRGGSYEIIYKTVAKQCQDFGFHCIGSASLKSSTKISPAVTDAVRASTLVVCDLSDPSHEAYYTAALAEGLSKPRILTCSESAKGKLQFEAECARVILWDKPETLAMELESEFRNFSRV